MATLSKGSLFEPVIVKEIFSKVRGHSSLVKLCPAKPTAFNGNEVFVFNMDSEISIVGENKKKPAGAVSLVPKVVTPIKVLYQARVSDEFVRASEEAKISILDNYNDGFAAKLASGLDKIAFHGINPATDTVSDLVTSYMDKDVINTVYFDAAKGGDAAIEAATRLLKGYRVNGLAIADTFAGILANETVGNTGVQKFPELAWGGTPDKLRNIPADVNVTVGPADYAIVGNFAGCRWGYASDIEFEVIEFGDPDGTGCDLKAYNQVLLRSEAYIGFAVIDPDAFARVLPAAAEG